MLKNKKILVTGAAGFLGMHLMKSLSEAGADVIGIDQNPSTNIINIDITNTNELDELSKHIGALDGIVNNAALSYKGNNISAEQFDKTLSVNISGTKNCIDKLYTNLVINASIVNVASIYGVLSPDFGIYEYNEDLYNSSAYGASKAAIIQMTKYYAVQMAPIRVNAVSPGGIYQGHDQDFVKKYSSRVPLKRMAQPKEIVSAVIFLLSGMSSYISGHNLIIDGGLSAW